jgi:CRP-like cAMP-binding protein
MMIATSNHILSSLSPEDAAFLAPQLSPVEFPLRFVVEKVRRPVEHVYFPDDGILSVVAEVGSDRQSEAGTVGRDACTGFSVILGGDRAISTIYAQVPGHGWRISAESLRTAIMERVGLRELLNRAVEAFLAQCTFTVVTNSRGKIEQRLSRWLLMAHDRLHGDTVNITHDLLSVMLGVRRPGVTTMLQYLEERGAVKTGRANILIVNRPLLEQLAGRYYGPAEAEQFRLTGWQPKSARPVT